MKNFILFILLWFFASFLLSCHKSTLEIVDEYNIDSDKSPLFEIKIGNEKVSWNEFSYFNEDELIYVYDGNICLNNVVLAEFRNIKRESSVIQLARWKLNFFEKYNKHVG